MLAGCTPWPPETAERYRAAGYWRGANLGDLPREWAAGFGSRTALVHAGTRLTFSELHDRIDRMAAGFRDHGIEPGDRVVVQLPNIPEFVVVCFALFRIGAKPVFSLISHRESEIRHLCEIASARAYVVPGRHGGFDYTELAERVLRAAPSLEKVFVADGTAGQHLQGKGDSAFVSLAGVDGEPHGFPEADTADVAFFLLSGGTTALPKLIPRTHDDYDYQTRAAAELVGLGPEDVYLAALPVEFNFAWGCPGVIGTLRSGGTVVLAEEPVPYDCFELIERERATLTSLVPAVAQMWLDAAEQDMSADLSSLRLLQIGGARLHPETAQRVQPVLGCTLQQVFGMAEGLLCFTRLGDPTAVTLNTQGRPLSPDDEIRIVDESGEHVPDGGTGELLTRGPYTLRGYYLAAEHNARAFTADGFYRSGDLVRRTDDGDLVVQGRLKDVIIRGGNKVSAEEVEGHLSALPEVESAAVVGVPDARIGERIHAYVQVRGRPPTLAGIREALQGLGIADFKLPDRLVVMEALPLTGLGKVDKKVLAAYAGAEAPASRTAGPAIP